ncbi:hypothetical protein ZIOFF_007141 [Zingiber officinale]|uniref:FRIGIDA-like protein n=1 Tax=Zingiber officinale TaxID=94328 RepID=A0A8J5LPQ7_ZINOF|nr:hypothetical protein ZIOFF_007141 [Zingiber officinale]
MLIEGGRLVEKQTAMSSECSSGCQSGWTTYFLHSSDVRNSLSYGEGESFRGVEEEEGLSMISDASSGPPHFNEDDGNGRFLYSALVPADGGKKKRTLVEQQRNQHSSALDDTASSQLFNNPEVNSFTDCNYRMKKSMEETFFQSQEQVLQAQSALRVQMGYSQCSACVKQNPTRPVKIFMTASISLLELFECRSTDIIEELINNGHQLDAISFAHEAGLQEKFPLVQLLKSFQYGSQIATSTAEDSNNSGQTFCNTQVLLAFVTEYHNPLAFVTEYNKPLAFVTEYHKPLAFVTEYHKSQETHRGVELMYQDTQRVDIQKVDNQLGDIPKVDNQLEDIRKVDVLEEKIWQAVSNRWYPASGIQ